MLLLLPPSTIFDSPNLSLVCEIIGYKTTDIFWNGNGLSMHISFGNGFELLTCDRKIEKMIEYVCVENFFYVIVWIFLICKIKGWEIYFKVFYQFLPYFHTYYPANALWGKNWPKSYDSENLVILLNLTLRNLESGSPKKTTSQVDVTHLSFN